jgi:hypothetical protein
MTKIIGDMTFTGTGREQYLYSTTRDAIYFKFRRTRYHLADFVSTGSPWCSFPNLHREGIHAIDTSNRMAITLSPCGDKVKVWQF